MNSKRQGVLSIFLSRGLYFGVGISYILAHGIDFTVINFLLGFFLGLFMLILMLNCDWQVFFQSIWGKIIILGLSFFLVNNCLIAFAVLGSNFYLINTPPLFIVGPLIILIIYGVKKGLATTLRLSDILIFTSVIVGTIAILSIQKNIDFSNYFPLEMVDKTDTLKCIFSSAFFSVSPIILELAFLKKDEVNKKAIIYGYLIGGFTIFLMILCILGIFGGEFACIFRYPEYILLKKVNLFNQFEHLENFLSILWFNDLIITSLLAGLLINKVFKNNWLYVVSIIHLAFVYFFFINNYQHILMLYHYTFYILEGLVVLGIPSAFIATKIEAKKRQAS